MPPTRGVGQEESLHYQRPPIVANNLASRLANHRESEADLDRAQALALKLKNSPVPQFKDTIGWISYRRGDLKLAVSLLEEAVEGLPNHPLVRYHLGRAYAALQQNDKALEQLQHTIDSQEAKGDLRAKAKAAMEEIASKPEGARLDWRLSVAKSINSP